MGSTPRTGLVGGIARVVLHHPSSPLPEVGVVCQESGSLLVELLDSGSYYLEERVVDEGLRAIKHTLSLAIDPQSPIFDESAMERAIIDGLVADITLFTGQQFRVGWSERYGVALPLQLSSATYSSGAQLSEAPTRSWVMSCVDTSSHI